MINRRTLLTGAGAAALALPALPALAAQRAPAGSLPTTVLNKSGSHDNASIRLYIVGTDLTTGAQSRVTPEGKLVPVSLDDNGPDGYTDYAIPLASSGATQLGLPYLSGRIYIALGGELKFKAVADGNGNPALQYPAGWVESDPNYPVLHDFVEFTHNASGMYCNTTMVDQFSVPLSIKLDGSQSQTTGTLVDGGRANIFQALANQEGFDQLVLDGDLRVIAPGHGLDAGRFDGSYLDGYIDQVWEKYRGTDLRVRINPGVFSGRVDGSGQLVLTGDAPEQPDPISKPSTRDVLFCDGALHAPNDPYNGPVAAVLGANFNRSTLHQQTEQPSTDPATFYHNPVTNHYARVLHENTVDGKAYGFAFDDVAGFASYIQDTAPAAFTVTLTPF